MRGPRGVTGVKRVGGRTGREGRMGSKCVSLTVKLQFLLAGVFYFEHVFATSLL